MTMNVLNIAAGYLPLTAGDFGVDLWVNYDPLDSTLLTAKFEYTVRHLRDVNYCTRRAQVDPLLPNGGADLIVGISPFGFALIDNWANGKLKPGGYVICISNERNPYGAFDGMVTAPALRAIYAETPQAPSWMINVMRRIQDANTSQTTGLGRATQLNRSVILVKHRPRR